MNALRAAMTAGLFLVTLPSLAHAQSEPAPLRYLRLDNGKYVLESEITETRTDGGRTFVSRTERGAEKITLTLTHDKANRLTRAEALFESPQARQSALVTVGPTGVQLKRAGVVDFLKLEDANPIVTTAPDWSDILQIVRRYDPTKGGRQSFPGLWIHPTLPHLVLTFTAERAGEDLLRTKEKDLSLERYRIHLRSGDYLVWTEKSRRVVKLMPAGKPAAAVVLEGYQELARGLGQ